MGGDMGLIVACIMREREMVVMLHYIVVWIISSLLFLQSKKRPLLRLVPLFDAGREGLRLGTRRLWLLLHRLVNGVDPCNHLVWVVGLEQVVPTVR